jgi:hypothetical protein
LALPVLLAGGLFIAMLRRTYHRPHFSCRPVYRAFPGMYRVFFGLVFAATPDSSRGACAPRRICDHARVKKFANGESRWHACRQR